MYKTNDRDMDVLCPMPILFSLLRYTQHHHPPIQHLSLNILLHNNNLCFSIQLKIPKIDGIKRRTRGIKKEKKCG